MRALKPGGRLRRSSIAARTTQILFDPGIDHPTSRQSSSASAGDSPDYSGGAGVLEEEFRKAGFRDIRSSTILPR